MSHLENNYILESLRQAGWFDLFESDIQALLIFDPLITLWGNFVAPYLKLLNDARVASACFYVRTCRRVRNSKKIATIRDFHLPGSFLCLSTRLRGKLHSCKRLFLREFTVLQILTVNIHIWPKKAQNGFYTLQFSASYRNRSVGNNMWC